MYSADMWQQVIWYDYIHKELSRNSYFQLLVFIKSLTLSSYFLK